jgi:excisionase family DNA binding protein
MENGYLDIHQLSALLNVKPSTLYSMVEAREITHYRIGRLIRFKKEEVDAWMETHRRDIIHSNLRAKDVLKITGIPVMDIDRIVKKSIDESKTKGYTSNHGKPGQIKDLRKEVKDGTF